MDETEIEKSLRNLDVLPADKDSKRRTKDDAWTRLSKKQILLWRSGFAKAASVILVIGISFGALSYTVTQSTRSGGGDAGRETSKISSSQITQYPASIRTSIVRMVVGGLEPEMLRFNAPKDFGDIVNPAVQVFHPQGGGATYIKAPADVMADGLPGEWVFNDNLAIKGIGTAAADLTAYLVGVRQDICESLNGELGINAVPKLQREQSRLYTDKGDIAAGDGAPQFLSNDDLSRQPFGCFLNFSDEKYIYYHVLIEK